MAWEFGNTGLDKETLKEIHRILYSFPKVKEAVLFGSRAKGCPKKGSDIDIAIIGEKINLDDISTILAIFEASLIPFMIDLVDFRGIKNAGLLITSCIFCRRNHYGYIRTDPLAPA